MMTNPDKEYSSNMYHYDNFMESYFDNLTTNFGQNVIGSCGYVALGMILSYYDTYLDDDIVDNKYDVRSNGECYNVICWRDSPGTLYDEPYKFDTEENTYGEQWGDIAQRNMDYYRYMESKDEISLHAKLLTIGHSKLYYIHQLKYPAGLLHNMLKSVLNTYIEDETRFEEGEEYIIDEIDYSFNADKSNEVRCFVISKIQRGYPVLVHLDDEDKESHWVVAYDYDVTTDTIYCHFGWGSNSTHISPENCANDLNDTTGTLKNYYIYKSALTIEFNIPHRCSEKYGVITQKEDGIKETKYYCYCSEEIELYNNIPTYMSFNFKSHDLLFECGVEEHQVRLDHSFNPPIYDETECTLTCRDCEYISTKEHFFATYTVGDYSHTGICSHCKIEFSYNHNWTFVSVDGVTHTATCTDCGYTETESHRRTIYQSIDATHHSNICADCGYSVTQSHYFEYRTTGSLYHILKCRYCGATSGSSEAHIWTANNIEDTAKCKICNYIKFLAPGEFVPIIKTKIEIEEETE